MSGNCCWIVIDRDAERTNGGGHTLENFNQAFLQAKSKNIRVAYANPCFEIWVLLHFEYRNTAIDRDELYNRLASEKCYVKSELFTPLLDLNLQAAAIANSERLLKSWENQDINPATNNPSTTIHELVELLNGFKKGLNLSALDNTTPGNYSAATSTGN